jgi:hypothetical protein
LISFSISAIFCFLQYFSCFQVKLPLTFCRLAMWRIKKA